ncbi:MAG TPA: adenylate/guanylate cyclase domain-containing protein [Reyranella sp.]|nr:adenylate/guanylate cyclase domain-containing protein [Reyranella sp.]
MDEPSLVRRLTTIISVDVVGFSTMSARDEEHALDLLRTRMAIAEAVVKHHRGRVFKLTGDGMLAEFASPVEAVRAALEVQEAMRSANAKADANNQLQLRIGINLGDVVESGDDLMGDAVNVAVRLESIAPVGGICVSASIYEQIVGKLTLGAEDMGEQHVKNIPRPIHAYRLTLQGAAPIKPPTAKHPGRLVLAVGAVAAVAVLAGAGAWLLLDRPQPVSPSVQTAQTPPSAPPVAEATLAKPTIAPPATSAAPSAPPPEPSTPPPSRVYSAADVPFVGDFRRRLLDNYARAEDFKAMAINVRGIVAVAERRVDAPTARRVALEECDRAVQREVPNVRPFDRCMTYAVGNDVVWSYRLPPLPPPPYLPAKRPSPPITIDPAKVPLLGELGRRNLAEHYMTSNRKRAFVMGRNHFDWWTPSETEPDAIHRNLQICGHVTGRPCMVYALQDQVVVRAPERYRVVDVFTPEDLATTDAGQQQAVERYLVADDWRAIAAGRNGRVGIVSDRASESAAVTDALSECARAGGTECAVVAVGTFLVMPK